MTGSEGWAAGYRMPLVTLAAVAVTAVLALVAGARAGALALAAVLAAASAVRALVKAPGPGIAIRTRVFDVAFLGGLALVIGVFAATSSGV